MAVSDFFKGGIGSSSGVSVAGRIDAGHVQVGEQVVAIPGGEVGVVKSKVSHCYYMFTASETETSILQPCKSTMIQQHGVLQAILA